MPLKLESDNESPFQNKTIQEWAADHGVDWVHHIPSHPWPAGKIEWYNGLLKAMPKCPGVKESPGVGTSPPGSYVTNQHKARKLLS